MSDSTLSSALVKRKSDDMALMPPPPPPKRIKRPATVLDEDVYTDALSHIIARDFFSGLLETKAQQEYLDALDSNDNNWIREAGNNLKEAMTPDPYGGRGRRGTSVAQTPASVATTATPGRTPLGRSSRRDPSSTPMTTAHEDRALASPQIDLTLSLTSFQAKYTSEDNESFNGILDAQNLAKAKKYAFLRNNTNKLPSKQQLAQQKLLTSSSSSSSQTSTASSTALTVPNSSSLVQTSTSAPRPSQDLDARPASLNSFPIRQGARNTLMFYPSGIEDDETSPTHAQTAEAASPAPPRRTNFAATRLPGPEAERPAVPPSPSMSAVDAAIAGRPRMSQSERGSRAGSEAGYDGAETPMVAGWRFVDAEPTEDEMVASGETKGRIMDEEEVRRAEREEMRRLLPHGEGGGKGGFRMSDRSRREELLDRMVEKNERAKRKGMRSDEGRQRGNLTPAGRSLVGRLGTPVGRTPGGGLFGGAGKGGGKAWTPMRTPGVKR
ncbi:hypothetical protein C1H76_8361 [Elsinoe australis]|uniref:Protein DGCR14 n=1 Tax=Elsinoe australis TaxID=40998 RepID=A0A4V6DT70_9PEZI|nr:hypothetical protein C1H76_8361 [Elsinoe australis]